MLQPEDDIVPKEFIGCKIDWKEGKDVTFEQVRMERMDRACPGSSMKPWWITMLRAAIIAGVGSMGLNYLTFNPTWCGFDFTCR